MPVSSEVFGDPCPNTRKYVEVHFACMPKVKTTTTKRPLPPWFLQVKELCKINGWKNIEVK